ncbi:MAG: CHAT domain-containing protein [Oculatellaceae cyanobacterium bins.114]|nr:CHAT domain-containing protein [Oculatellaceae cyanobacterium bins.114]
MARKWGLFFHRLHTVLRQAKSTRSKDQKGQFRTFSVIRHPFRFILPFVLTVLLCVAATPVLSQSPSAAMLAQTGQQLYETGQYSDAIATLQRAIQAYEAEGNSLGQAMALRNLALVYQTMGNLAAANEAIATSLQQVQSSTNANRLPTLARVLNLQGSLQLQQGQTEQALTTWEQATAIYQQLGDETGALRNQINQAQALQSLGFYRRAIATLAPLTETLQSQPDSPTKIVALRSLGEALQGIGSLARSQQMLEAALAIAQQLQLPNEISATQFSLGNTARAQGDAGTALEFYQQAAAMAPLPLTKARAELNQLSLLIDTDQVAQAQQLVPQITVQLDRLPHSQALTYAQVNFAQSLMRLGRVSSHQMGETGSPTAEQILLRARQHAQALTDLRAESFALGSLGGLYEKSGQLARAKTLTEQALVLAQTVNASDIAYRWQWQLGRILKAEADLQATRVDKYAGAIAAYSSAVDTLQSLRNDLVAINPEVQLSFQESVEPIHRQLVSLLLTPDGNETSQDNLEKARKVIESLQLAELDNFFREACLDAKSVSIDQLDAEATVVYPIILDDRLEVVISLPQQPLRHYSSPVPREEIENTITQIRRSLVTRTSRQFLPLARRLYDWIIRPAETDLANSGTKTLVFVLDGSLRNVPMAVLNDGQNYLLEKYSLALTPGLQLLDPRPLQIAQLKVLTAGLTESRQGFSALPSVLPELQQIQQEVQSRILLNESFTSTGFQSEISENPVSIVHLATHGKFSSELEQTFILTWDDRININQLNTLLQTADLTQTNPIELLVLSACQTAAGDRQAALGLAGIAVRAGARSTLATLWQVSDEATALLMNQFYQGLNEAALTKAEALRQAQLKVLQVPELRQHPYYWAPYVIVGNWL